MKKKLYLSLMIGITLLTSQSIQSQNWTMSQQIGSSDQAPADNLGISTSVSDSFMVAGAWWSEGNNGPNSSGAVYIYKLQENNSWKEYQKLVSPNPESLGYYGYEVAIKGTHILIGAYNEDHSGHGNAGRVYTYYIDEDFIWKLGDSLFINNPENADYFGYDIAMTENYAVIGAYRHPWDDNESNKLDEAGAAFVVKRDGTKWEIVKKLTAPDRAEDDFFGKYVAIDENGLVVSAFNKDQSILTSRSGAVYSLYCENGCAFENLGSTDLIKIENPDPQSFDNFGIGLAISGKWLAIGKPFESIQPDGTIKGNTGAVYFYKRSNEMWNLMQKVYASDYVGQAFFGETISMDGGICAIGASGEARDDLGQNPLIRAGAVYVFEINENEMWLEKQKLIGIGRSFDDLLADEGLSVSGNKISAGAWLADTINGNYLIDGGAVYIFERNGELPSSISSFPQFNKMKLLENPSAGVLRLFNEDQSPFKGLLEIYSINGLKIISTPINIQSHLSMDLSYLNQNIYWVKISNKEKQIILKWIKI